LPWRKLLCFRTRIEKSGPQLKIVWSLTPKAPLTGQQQLNARASDALATSPHY